MQFLDIVQLLVENYVCELEFFSDVFLFVIIDVLFFVMDMFIFICVGFLLRIVGKYLLEQMNVYDFVGYVLNFYWWWGLFQGFVLRVVVGI